MQQIATFESFRQAASDSGPHRLKRIVRFGAALGLAGVDTAAAIEEIENAIWADGALPVDRASQRRAWEVTRERALYAYENAPDVVDMAAYRARRDGRALFDALPTDATVDDLARAIGKAEPLFDRERALSIAGDVIHKLAQPPVVQRGPAPGPNPFAETRVEPTEQDYARHRKALRIMETRLGEAAMPERVVATDLNETISGWVDELRERGLGSAAEVSLEQMLTRTRLGLDRPFAQKGPGLAYLDFDPSVDTPPPTWLAKGLLPRAGIGLLFGESGAGKSFAAIHAALAVAWGLPLFGAKVQQGAVLYIAAEGGKSVVRRFKAADRALAGDIVSANLSRAGRASPCTRAPIRIVTEAPDLSREGDASPLVRTIQNAATEFEARGHRLALVIIDTWHAALGGAEENSAADAGHALKPLIAESERGDFLALIVHHPGKDTDRGARGSNALPAAADAIIAISVPGHEGAKAKPSSALRKAVVTKMRDGEAGCEFAYRLDVVETGRDEDGDPVTTCVVQPADLPKLDGEGLLANDRIFLEAVGSACAEGHGRARTDEVRMRFYAARPNSNAAANRKAWGRALDAAVGAGRVETDEHDLWISLCGSRG